MELELKDQKRMRKIPGSIKDGGEFRIRHNKRLNQQLQRIITTMRKKSLVFYNQVVKMILENYLKNV